MSFCRNISPVFKTRIFAAVLGTMLFVSGAAVGQVGRHPNLIAAQRFIQQAYEKIVAAQQANEYDMNGHAQKAKLLLDEVSRELKEAAGAASRN
jgi:hypothetical protein